MASTNPAPTASETAGKGPTPPFEPPNARQTLRDVWRGTVALSWRFFDWLAVVSWKTLLIVALLLLVIVAGFLNRPTAFFVFFLGSVIVKIVAGGKRRADIVAQQATQRALTEQLGRQVLEARMEALQAQIEPHFLFNTLGSIDQLIETDAPRASRMQKSLIRYLRSALPQMRGAARPTLGQQVDLSNAYLEIMRMRMEDRLQPVVNVPDGLRSAVFPSMMLQTLVENAVRHGLDPKAGGGTLEIKAEVADGQLAVHVLDNGVGFAPRGDAGVGLANIRERLDVLYGARAELIIGVPPGGGTCATIKLPYEVGTASAGAAPTLST